MSGSVPTARSEGVPKVFQRCSWMATGADMLAVRGDQGDADLQSELCAWRCSGESRLPREIAGDVRERTR